MEKSALLDRLGNSPIIAAVKNTAGLQKALLCDCEIVFILFGTINNISEVVASAKKSDKAVFVHMDLIDGLSAKESALDFIASTTLADGIISTKPNIIKYAKGLGLLTVQRFFVLDSLALENIHKADKLCDADFIEILPGLMPKIIKMLSTQLKKPLIAGGLISDKDDVVAALSANAVAVSTTCVSVWNL